MTKLHLGLLALALAASFVLGRASKNAPGRGRPETATGDPSRPPAAPVDPGVLPALPPAGSGPASSLARRLTAFQEMAPEELAREARKLVDLPLEEHAWVAPALFAAWAEQDPEGALHAATALKSGKDGIISMVLASWAASAPEDAAAFYKRNEQRLFTHNYDKPWEQVSGSSAIAKAVRERSGFEGAMKWAKGLRHLADKNEAVRSLVRAEALASPGGAASLLGSLSMLEQDDAVEIIAGVWAEADLESAISWINTLDEHQQQLAIPGMITGIAKSDPELAASYIDYFDANRDDAIAGILRPWLDLDAGDAADWLAASTTRDEYRQFIGPLLQGWVAREPGAAREWVLSREPGALQDEAASAYIRSASSGLEPPHRLIQMARDVVTDPGKREATVVDVLVSWSRTDPEASVRYANSAGLSDAAYAEYLHQSGADVPLE